MKDYIKKLEYPMDIMEQLGVESFSNEIYHLQQDLEKEYENKWGLKSLDTILSLLMAFNYKHISQYGFVKEFQDVANRISVIEGKDNRNKYRGIFVIDKNKKVTEELVDELVKNMIDGICKEACRIDY